MVYLDTRREILTEVIASSSSSSSRGLLSRAGSEHLSQALQAPQARQALQAPQVPAITLRLRFRRLSLLESAERRLDPSL